MKLDRNIDANAGRGKYALLKLRRFDDFREQGAFGEVSPEIAKAITTLADAGILDWGNTPETEFFVMRLKDKYAAGPLYEYALRADRDGEHEYATEVRALAKRAGEQNLFCKKPD